MKKYLIRNKAVFLMGVLGVENNATLCSRCKELGLKNYNTLPNKHLRQLILNHTDESVMAYTFEPELVAA